MFTLKKVTVQGRNVRQNKVTSASVNQRFVVAGREVVVGDLEIEPSDYRAKEFFFDCEYPIFSIIIDNITTPHYC